MEYLHWDQKEISDNSRENLAEMYSNGYVLTRLAKNIMQQTRSVRIDLNKFELSSENRRILKKNEGLTLAAEDLPLSTYDWHIGKMAKDFYTAKFGPKIMSAQKIKEMLTEPEKSNFNTLLTYTAKHSSAASDLPLSSDPLASSLSTDTASNIGFAISYAGHSFLHYSYPFYNLDQNKKDLGLGMMVLAILHGKNTGMKYIYLGSLQRPGDIYKLQFSGLQWFDGKKWSDDLDEVKKTLSSAKMD